MKNLTSTELHINNPNPPIWDPRKHYWEQSNDVLQYYTEEWKKITEGLNIGGYFFHPLLYFHINYFKAAIPTPVKGRPGNTQNIIKVPNLDDNIMYIIDNYKDAEERSMGMFLFGTRGFLKTTFLSSLMHWLSLTSPASTSSVVGGNSHDLNNLTNAIQTSLDNIHPAFYVPRIKTDWEKEVVFGIKEKSQKPIIHSNMQIFNADPDRKSKSEIGAGSNPSGFIIDEAGKFEFKNAWKSALPSFETPHGFKLTPVLSGCVCADTMVWNSKGELVKIQELKREDGIVGFDENTRTFSKEGISYWQPPHEKDCYRITLKSGKTLECSDDHPILYRSRLETETIDKVKRRKVYFKETKTLSVGDHVAIIESVDIWSDLEMWEPRLIGQLIGDGSYGIDHSPKISGCDKEIHDYVTSKFDTRLEDSYTTKDGKPYREYVIKGICGKLRELGIYGQTKKNKRLPTNIHSYSKKSVCSLIGGYFDADGYVSITGKNKMIGVSSISEELIKELQLLLQKLGIHSYINKKTHKPTKLVNKGCISFVLTIADKRSVNTFYENIKFSIKYKQDNLEKCIKKLEGHKERIDKNWGGLRFETVKAVEYIGKKPVYNLTADNTHTYVANGIVTHNTGGNTVLSKYAQKVLSNPESYKLIPVNWDLLERGVPDEFKTWERSKKFKFGTFVPGQMSYRLKGEKIKSNLSDFLGGENKALKGIEIGVTDWEAQTKRVKDKITDKNLDEDERNENKMYYPLETADCFLTKTTNPFPTKIIDRHIRKLEDEGRIGKDSELIYEGSSIKETFSDKRRAEISHPGGLADAPVILHESLPKEKPEKFLYISGFDGYKTDDSNTDSLGSIYVLKRRNLSLNTPFETIACSYTARPYRMKEFNKTCEKIVEAFNSECCMEAIDVSFLHYLEDKGKAHDYLAPAYTFANSKSANSTLRSRFGIPPTAGNNEYRMNVMIEAMKEEHTVGFDEESGDSIVKYGCEFIDDIDLLKEMLNYYKGGNFDRITAFSHALVHARELDKKRVLPTNKKSNNVSEQPKKRKSTRNPYGNIRLKKY